MKNYYLLLILLLTCTFSVAQPISIPDTNLTIEMPNEKWELVDTQSSESMEVYYYKREPIEDSKGRQIIPNISIIVEDNEGLDVVTYSAAKRIQMPPLDIMQVYIPKDIKMKYKNGIGYKAGYSDKHGKHIVQLMFVNEGNNGLRIICDVMEEQYDTVEAEFLTTLRSIRKQ